MGGCHGNSKDELRIFPPGRNWPMESGKVGEGTGVI